MDGGKSLKKNINVSVIVATYNPAPEKLWDTLYSIVNQKLVKFEIIIADDGSKNSLSNEIKEYMSNHNFCDYRIITHAHNQGTVLNCYDAVNHACGIYVKLISPGDFFTDDKALYNWVNHLVYSGYKWSLGDAIYYVNDGNKRAISQAAHPQDISTYIKKRDKKSRWNYLVLDDIALGAAVICQRNFLLKYLERIIYKVIYAEDNVYRMMMFDGEAADYYPNEVLFYEFGTGISTNGNSKWDELLRKDWNMANEIMLYFSNEDDRIQNKIKKEIQKKYSENRFIRLINKVRIDGWLEYKMKEIFRPRMTKCRSVYFRIGD